MTKPKTRIAKKVIALLGKDEKDVANKSDELELVPKEDEAQLPAIEVIEEAGDLAPFETYIADLTALAQVTQVIETLNAVQEEELNKRITHYPPSDRLH